MTAIKDVAADMVAAIDARTALTTGTSLFVDTMPPADGTVLQTAVSVQCVGGAASTRSVRANSATGEFHPADAFVVLARGEPRDPKTARDACETVLEALHLNPPSGYLNVVVNGQPFPVPATDGDLDVPYFTVDGYATYEE